MPDVILTVGPGPGRDYATLAAAVASANGSAGNVRVYRLQNGETFTESFDVSQRYFRVEADPGGNAIIQANRAEGIKFLGHALFAVDAANNIVFASSLTVRPFAMAGSACFQVGTGAQPPHDLQLSSRHELGAGGSHHVVYSPAGGNTAGTNVLDGDVVGASYASDLALGADPAGYLTGWVLVGNYSNLMSLAGDGNQGYINAVFGAAGDPVVATGCMNLFMSNGTAGHNETFSVNNLLWLNGRAWGAAFNIGDYDDGTGMWVSTTVVTARHFLVRNSSGMAIKFRSGNWCDTTAGTQFRFLNGIIDGAAQGTHLPNDSHRPRFTSAYTLIRSCALVLCGGMQGYGAGDGLGVPVYLDEAGGDFHAVWGAGDQWNRCPDGGLAYDADNVSRPQGVAYDAGPYEVIPHRDCGLTTLVQESRNTALATFTSEPGGSAVPLMGQAIVPGNWIFNGSLQALAATIAFVAANAYRLTFNRDILPGEVVTARAAYVVSNQNGMCDNPTDTGTFTATYGGLGQVAQAVSSRQIRVVFRSDMWWASPPELGSVSNPSSWDVREQGSSDSMEILSLDREDDWTYVVTLADDMRRALYVITTTGVLTIDGGHC